MIQAAIAGAVYQHCNTCSGFSESLIDNGVFVCQVNDGDTNGYDSVGRAGTMEDKLKGREGWRGRERERERWWLMK